MKKHILSVVPTHGKCWLKGYFPLRMVNVEGQCKLRGYSNPKKHWKLKGCLCIKKTCKMTCSFSKIGSISPSLLHWSFLDLLWSGNPDWQNFDLKISFTMWFSHIIHMTKALPKQIDLPHATAENWDFIHPGIGTVVGCSTTKLKPLRLPRCFFFGILQHQEEHLKQRFLFKSSQGPN